MEEWSRKTAYLLGESACNRLNRAHVAVVGVGGVGAFAAEFLCRSGIGHLTLLDSDTVSESNRNRQLPALCSTYGRIKVEVMAERMKDIRPEIDIRPVFRFLSEEGADEFVRQKGAYASEPHLPFDFVVDAIDTVPSKVALLVACVRNRMPVVSAMGAAGKLDPEQVRCADISKTFQCGLARAVRQRLSKEGIREGVPVVFSPEVSGACFIEYQEGERPVPGTVSYMPALFGCHLASYVIRQLCDRKTTSYVRSH